MKKIIAIMLLSLITYSSYGQVIPGFRISMNYVGYDPTPGSPVYVPITNNPAVNGIYPANTFKPEYAHELASRFEILSGRDMDLIQAVTNRTKEYADIQANDYGPNGIRPITDIAIANQMLALIPDYTPQINLPLMSSTDYVQKVAALWRDNYHGKNVRIALGNEVWSVYSGNLGEWNLLQAKAEGFQGDDFRILGLRQGERLAQHAKTWMSVFNGNTTTVIEGFAPIAQYVKNQLDGMTLIGIDPKSLNARISIAQYDAGSSTDLQGPLTTNTEKKVALDKFADQLVSWTLQHRAVAKQYGLTDVVDAYELRFGNDPTTDVQGWKDFQLTTEEEQHQIETWHKIVAASGMGNGIVPILMAEGYRGYPWNNLGQFNLIDLGMENDPTVSGAYRGTVAVEDFSGTSIPEPGCLWLTLTGIFLRRRHDSRRSPKTL
jgi:hypothetical protein